MLQVSQDLGLRIDILIAGLNSDQHVEDIHPFERQQINYNNGVQDGSYPEQ
jgi:hypothetical protein